MTQMPEVMGEQRSSRSSRCFERGQALIIVIFGIFVLLILVGLAVDLGLYYIERVRITRAVDSAALGAAYELPLESAAQSRAEDLLLQNGYDPRGEHTQLLIDGVVEHNPLETVRTTVEIDTSMFREVTTTVNSAYRIQVHVKQKVPVIFLRFAGFDDIACSATSVAENINDLDIVFIFDRSGSMEFDTLCYGCWEPDGTGYPNGDLYPLPWDGPANGGPQHCDSYSAYNDGSHDYYFIEAEEYFYSSNYYDRDLYSAGYTYWVMQRTPSSASSRDGRGAYLMHMPFPDMEVSTGVGVACRYEEIDSNGDGFVGEDEGKCWSGAPGGPYDAPWVSYNFSPESDGSYYIWARGQAAYSWRRGDGLHARLFWGIDENGDGVPAQLGWGEPGNCGLGCEGGFFEGTGYDGASGSGWRWQWRRLNNTPYYMERNKQYFLIFWAGGAQFAFDRIAITTNPYIGDENHRDWSNYQDQIPGPLQQNNGRGVEEWANGRAEWACDPCDSRFAGYPSDHPDRPAGFDPSDWVWNFPACDSGPNPDRRLDYLYDDEQPIRASIEAAKLFVDELLDPRYDQIGYVSYSTNATIENELECLRRLGSENCTEEVIDNTVVYNLDGTTAGGSTNIAGGMMEGLRVLQTDSQAACEAGTGHCGRPGATHVMIVMTDGRANQTPNDYCDDDSSRQWVYPNGDQGDNAQDCVIYYAHEARDENVVVYTITLGGSADFELMEEVADLTNGVHRSADRPEQLPAIFEELYELMYLRLVK